LDSEPAEGIARTPLTFRALLRTPSPHASRRFPRRLTASQNEFNQRANLIITVLSPSIDPFPFHGLG
jgi:hypothetical protein